MTDDVKLEPLLAGLSQEAAGLLAELRALGASRWRLLRLEMLASLHQVRRLAIVCAFACGAIATSVPVIVVAGSDALAGVFGIPRWGWLLIAAGFLISGAVVAIWFAYRRFRREFTGISESLEELGEDLVWLQEFRDRSR